MKKPLMEFYLKLTVNVTLNSKILILLKKETNQGRLISFSCIP